MFKEMFEDHFDTSHQSFTEYVKIIGIAKLLGVDGYSEKHHILPRSLGGENNKGNLVRLKASDHLKAHYHLMQMAKTDLAKDKMTKSFWLMHTQSKANSGRLGDLEWVEIISENYEEVRKLYSEHQKKKYFGKSLMQDIYTKDQMVEILRKSSKTRVANGYTHSQETRKNISEANKKRFEDKTNVPAFGKQWINNPLTGEKVRIEKGDPIPQGWVSGIGKRKERSDKGSSKGSISEEHRQKISDSLKKKHENGEYDHLVGAKRSEETKNKIREARKDQIMTPEHMQKLRDGRYNKTKAIN